MGTKVEYWLRHQTAMAVRAAVAARWHWLEPNRQVIALVVLVMLLAFALNVLLERGKVLMDDIRYGKPRTMQLSAYVGHSETKGDPSHFIALNLRRQIIVIELPGSDPTKLQLLQGPYLFGADADLTPVTVGISHIDPDDKPDLVISVENEAIIYINSDDTFRLLTDEERRRLVMPQEGTTP